MAEKNEYFTQKLENGTLQISEDVVASVAAAAVLEVEGVCGLSSSISTDIAEILGMKAVARGIRLTNNVKDGTVKIECDVVAKFGQSVFSLAKTGAGQRQDERGVHHGAARVSGRRQHLRHRHAARTEKMIIRKSKPFAWREGFLFW